HLADDRLVVDDENLRHAAPPASGSLRTNVAPVPTVPPTLRSPPCARAISRLAASPRPVPDFVEVNGSNRCLRMLRSTPSPVSVTVAPAQAPSRSSRTVAMPPA